jgi:hypothetical protein
MGRGSIVIGGRALSSAVTGAMRAAFRGLSVKSLKFTATTAARMATKRSWEFAVLWS